MTVLGHERRDIAQRCRSRQEELADAEVALRLARREALLGTHYDADAHDALAYRYQAARQRADTALVPRARVRGVQTPVIPLGGPAHAGGARTLATGARLAA